MFVSLFCYSPGFLLELRRNDTAVPKIRGGSQHLIAVTAYQSTALDHPCSPAHLIYHVALLTSMKPYRMHVSLGFGSGYTQLCYSWLV